MILNHYIVASERPWGRYAFEQARLPENWHFADRLGFDIVTLTERVVPRYVFFVHWSAIVAPEITERCECINFHMTDLPYGRGGSPLQNLIAAGKRDTVITAHRMTQEVDAGPVYAKRQMTLEGSAEEIYLRAARISLEMAVDIAEREPTPLDQEFLQGGRPNVRFSRRKPAQSRIPSLETGEFKTLEALFDHVRMLDAEGYPPAFLEHGGFRFEFSRAALRTGKIVCDVSITEVRMK